MSLPQLPQAAIESDNEFFKLIDAAETSEEREALLEARRQARLPKEVNEEKNFWQSRLATRQALHIATCRIISPYAVLGAMMAQTLMAVSPRVVLPAIVGDYASLNLYETLVARSGGSKSASMASAREYFRIQDSAGHEQRFYGIDVSTGEGIIQSLQRQKDEEGNLTGPCSQVYMEVDEISTMAARIVAGDSILSGTLCSVWSGRQVSTNPADASRKRIAKGGEYRACLIAAAQPVNAEKLLSEAVTGLPQRFLWLEATRRPDLCDYRIDGEEPRSVAVQLPDEAPSSMAPGDRIILPIPQSVRRQIRQAYMDGTLDEDPMMGHEFLVRLKVAAAFAFMAERWGINEEDWELAGFLMKHSREQVKICERAVIEQQKAEAAKRAEIYEAEQEARASERTEKTKKRILAIIGKHPEGAAVPFREIYNGVSRRQREVLNEALGELQAAGHLFAEESDSGHRFSMTKMGLQAQRFAA